MSTDEESDLRKEQLRLQNALLANQLHERARGERRAAATKQLAKDVGHAGWALTKVVAYVLGAGVLMVVAALLSANGGGSCSSKTSDDGSAHARQNSWEWAKAECRRGYAIVRKSNGELGAIDPQYLEDGKFGGVRPKTCAQIEAGEMP